MKAASFRHVSARSVEEVCALLAEHRDAAKVIAGGQSLVPMMNFRMVSPEVLIDINALADLRRIEETEKDVRIGALATHRQVETSELVRLHAPLLTLAVQNVAHQAVRNRGTFGGSLCHADPAAEFPACVVLLNATLELGSSRGRRDVAASEFFLGTFATAIEPDELLVAVRFPKSGPDSRFAFRELSRRHGDFAISGVAARVYVDPATGQPPQQNLQTSWVVFGVADHPLPMPALARLYESWPDREAIAQGINAAALQDLQEYLPDNETGRLQAVLTPELARRCADDLFNLQKVLR